MASSSTANSSTSGGQPGGQNDTKVVDQIPEVLNQCLLMIVKNFFSNEHFLVVYYIMRAECIREEKLRQRLCFDQKQIRQLLASLKQEKLVKEHLEQRKNEHNRNVSAIFYYINYRAVINVLKYKIDHMRQKLEAKEKNDTTKAHYKCTNCQSTYDMLEVDSIMDMHTGTLRCWRCRGVVETDESVAPSNLTRTSVARFNEQMVPLFSRIQALNGIQLAPHLLTPDFTKFVEEDQTGDLAQTQAMDFTANGGNRIQLGGVAHSYNAHTLNYKHGDQITVDLNADVNKGPVEEAKQVPLWLQDNAIAGSEATHNMQLLSQVNEEEQTEVETNEGLSIEVLMEYEGFLESEQTNGEPESKRSKASENEEESEDEMMIDVGGSSMSLYDVTPRMVEDMMSDAERDRYSQVVIQKLVY